MQRLSPDQLLQELCGVEDLLIVQDLDGVCMQLVNDPLTRQMDGAYVMAAGQLGDTFAVLLRFRTKINPPNIPSIFELT